MNVKAARTLMLVAVVLGFGVGIAVGQQGDAPAGMETAQGRVYEVGPDVVAPELHPMVLPIKNEDKCERESDDEIALSLIVDANGKPRDVRVINPVGTPLERLAMRIVEEDAFEPGTLNGAAVQVRLLAHVNIEGCYATKKDASGNSTEVFRLRAQPKQTFGEEKRQEYIAPKLPDQSDLPTPPELPKPPEPDTLGLERIGHGVSAPVPLNTVAAKYSEEARRKEITGVCLISMIVDTQGKPQNPRVIRSLGYGLDEKALEAVRKYHFKPAMKGKVPVPVMITVEVNFRLY
jgi:TonB family protein